MPEPLAKGEQSRMEIMDAARQLFLTNGYHGTSMRAIAQAAGDRAVAGLYNHFPTKEALFHALIEERNPYNELFAALEGATEGTQSAPEFLRRALRSVLSVMPRHYDFIHLAQIDFREFEGRNISSVIQGKVLPQIMLLIEHLKTLPGFKPINEFVWLRLMASIVIGFMVTDQIAANTPFGMYDHDTWTDLIVDTLLHGVADPNFTDASQGDIDS